MKLKVDIDAAAMADEKAAVESLSPRSALFAHTDSTYIIATLGFDSPVDVRLFKQAMSRVLLHYPRYSSLLVGDGNKNDDLRWVHIKNMKVDDHIKVVPCANTNTNDFVGDYIHSLTKTTLDPSKPLWDIHLLDLKTNEAESVGIFRFHHALGDGTSIISLLLSHGRQISNPDALPTCPTISKRKEKNVNPANTVFLAIWWWLQVFWNTIVGFLRWLATTLFLKDSDFSVIANPDEAKTKPRRIVYKIVSLDDIKLVKNAMNVTVNDVALGVTEAGFSRYLARKFRNDDNNEEKKAKNFLQNLRMTITVAVNIRAVKGPQSLAEVKDKSSKFGWGNQIGFGLLPLSIGLRDDPLEYVRKGKAKMDRMKHSFEAKCNHKINEIATKLFGIKVAGSMWLNYTSHVSVLFSNVPGPVEKISFGGHPIKFIAPTVYALPVPVVIHFQSYNDKMAIVLSVREDAIFDPNRLGDDIAQSLVLLKQAINK